jgi:hypothetical protein
MSFQFSSCSAAAGEEACTVAVVVRAETDEMASILCYRALHQDRLFQLFDQSSSSQF